VGVKIQFSFDEQVGHAGGGGFDFASAPVVAAFRAGSGAERKDVRAEVGHAEDFLPAGRRKTTSATGLGRPCGIAPAGATTPPHVRLVACGG